MIYATKEDALHAFWSSFGIKAKNELTVPDNIMETSGGHYISYNAPIASLDEQIPIYALMYYKDYSWDAISEKRKEIEEAIGRDGARIPYDGGVLWITRGVPFSQQKQDADDTIRCLYLNLTAEYCSGN